jgi:DHA2 family multidrug resistance protein
MKDTRSGPSMAWYGVIGGIIAVFMSILDIQIVNAALGEIQQAVHSSLSEGSWISSSYLIAEIIGLPLAHVVLNYFGLRRASLLFCTLFVFGSILCSQAWSLNSLILFRVIQGFSAGILMALSYVIIIVKLTKPQDNQLAIILYGTIVSIAPTVGPLLGGIIAEYLNWKFLFYINIPFGILAFLLMWYGLSADNVKSQHKKVDWMGVISVSMGLGCLQYTLEEGYKYQWFQSSSILYIFIISIISLLFFVVNEIRTESPLINLRLLKNVKFSIACFGAAIAGAAIYSYLFMIPYLLNITYNYSPIQISYVVMWVGFAQLFMILFARFLLKHLNIFIMISCGFFLFSLSVYIWASLSIKIIFGLIIVSGIMRGISATFFQTPLGILATTSAPKEHASSASSLFNVSRSLGGAIGIACMASFTNSRKEWDMGFYQLAFVDSFQLLAFLLSMMGLLFFIIYLFSVCYKKTPGTDAVNNLHSREGKTSNDTH